MKKDVNKIGYEISKLNNEEINDLNFVLTYKYGFKSDIYKYPIGIIPISPETITYCVQLTNAGSKKLAVLKMIKEMFGLGLREAKDIVDGVPSVLINETTLSNAEKIKAELEELDAVIDIM